MTFADLAVDGEPVSFLRHVEPEPEVCEWDESLTAADEACVEPDENTNTDSTDNNDQTSTSTDENSDNGPAAVPTAVPAGAKELPETGVGPMLLALGGLALLGLGGGMLRLRHRRAHGHYRRTV